MATRCLLASLRPSIRCSNVSRGAARYFSSGRKLHSETNSGEGSSSSDEVPWYLQDPDAVQQVENKHIEPLPEFPSNSPAPMKAAVEHMVQELGLVDVEIVDLRELERASIGPSSLMVVASGKSDKHLIRAANGLHKWLKSEYGVISDREGILTANFHRVHQRRQRKKAQRQFFYIKNTDDGVFQKNNSWVVLDTKLDGVIVHLFTPERRQEIALDTLWTAEEDDEISVPIYKARLPSGKREFHTTRPVTQALLQTYALSGDFQKCVQLRDQDNDESCYMLKSHINHLITLANKPKEVKKALDRNSAVVKSFLTHFPVIPNAYHWRMRLIFFQNAHMIQPEAFPLRMLVDLVIHQQASGFPASEWDVTLVVTAIAYSNQHFPVNIPGADKKEKWTHQCDEKFKLVLDLLKVTNRSAGKPITASETLLGLLHRLCIQSQGYRYITYSTALRDPTPSVPLRRGALDDRLFTLMKLSDEKDKPLIAMVMTALANDAQWTKFWVMWKDLVLRNQIDEQMLVFFVSLVTRAADEKAIMHLIDFELPEILYKNRDYANPKLLKAIQAALDYINPRQNGYHHLRLFISQRTQQQPPHQNAPSPSSSL